MGASWQAYWSSAYPHTYVSHGPYHARGLRCREAPQQQQPRYCPAFLLCTLTCECPFTPCLCPEALLYPRRPSTGTAVPVLVRPGSGRAVVPSEEPLTAPPGLSRQPA